MTDYTALRSALTRHELRQSGYLKQRCNSHLRYQTNALVGESYPWNLRLVRLTYL
jgi:hypothetical protein